MASHGENPEKALRKGKTIQQRYGGHNKNNPLGLGKKLAILGVGFLLFLLVLAAVGFLIYKGLGRSDFFQITSINIQGCRRTTKNQILEMSGVDIHSNLLTVNAGRIRDRIEAHDWVESVKVEKDWPNRLHINVKERLPVAIASLADGLYYLDEQGVCFAQVLPPEDMDYPVITGLSRDDWPRELKDSRLGEALQFIRHANQGNSILPKQNISELHLGEGEELLLYLVDRPFPIHLGRGNMASKYYWLVKVLYRLYKSKEFVQTAYIRMDYAPNKVLVGFTGPVQAEAVGSDSGQR